MSGMGAMRVSGAGVAICLAVVIILARVAALPLMPIDETRYLSIAWEMWQHQALLVPTLNGEPYSHKPPLLFWLIQLGWWLFGTSGWVARLVIPAVGLTAFWLVADIVRQLAPDARREAGWAPLVLLGTTLWFVYLPLSMFDILLSTCLLAAVDAWLRYLCTGRPRLVLLAGLGLGLGVLAKGPVVFVYWLPLALGTRFWWPDRDLHQARTWTALLAASLLGGLIGLAWALLAALAGGADFANAILWHQAVGRVSNAFDHARPWYWYLPVLLIALLPWSLSSLWRRPWAATPLQRFAVWGSLPPLVLLSLISGKQVHYLMPILPFLAIWISGRLVAHPPSRPWGNAALLMGLAGVLAVLPDLSARLFPAAPLSPWTRLGALVPLALALWLLRRPCRAALVLAWPLTLFTLLLLLSPALQRYYDLTPMARRLSALEARGIPVAYAGEYHNQFRFLGRLETDLAVIDDARALRDWVAAHPRGEVIEVRRAPTARQVEIAGYHQPYRGRALLMVPAARWPAFLAASADAGG
ncbi:ArnT family glycosyltransferase [Halomonas ventosae]|uniref:4-amino-4-deoxy-L-arabinose transferase-like glycosyltransferase n=1 Tax=Halomonas ventosae TaxID=229007 RepID=A0A2T0VMM8_9GAMM|nr:glycosyltransferase family 39 protein [Halomonas ventosae]PRY71542.1 4-amino-4-deoxy-L-arabinose transferase-like glycosyltransferase [Halomonas ventosae]